MSAAISSCAATSDRRVRAGEHSAGLIEIVSATDHSAIGVVVLACNSVAEAIFFGVVRAGARSATEPVAATNFDAAIPDSLCGRGADDGIPPAATSSSIRAASSAFSWGSASRSSAATRRPASPWCSVKPWSWACAPTPPRCVSSARPTRSCSATTPRRSRPHRRRRNVSASSRAGQRCPGRRISSSSSRSTCARLHGASRHEPPGHVDGAVRTASSGSKRMTVAQPGDA